MNDEEIEWHKRRREPFWNDWKKETIPIGILVIVILGLFMAGCQPTSSQRGIPQPYNLTLMANSSGYVSLVQAVNTNLVDGLFGVFTLVAIFIIATLALISITAHPLKAIATSSFIVFVMSLLLRTMNLVPDYAVYVSLGLAAVSTLFLVPRD